MPARSAADVNHIAGRFVGQHQPEMLVDSAVAALAAGSGYGQVLDALDVPAYATDAEGRVTYWNQACVAFAGREPKLGRDRWCVTWQLYTTSGELLPHDRCPMATAVKEQRAVRDQVAIAKRPDGSRIAFRPYPTPLFDRDGRLAGAINLLIDVTGEQSEALHEQALRCQRLADATYDRQTSKVLEEMAADYERTAGELARRACGP